MATSAISPSKKKLFGEVEVVAFKPIQSGAVPENIEVGSVPALLDRL